MAFPYRINDTICMFVIFFHSIKNDEAVFYNEVDGT